MTNTHHKPDLHADAVPAQAAAPEALPDEYTPFERAFLSANSLHTRAEMKEEWEGGISGVMFRAGIAAAQPEAKAAPASATLSDEQKVEAAARAMAKHADWGGWDTAKNVGDTLSGNEPEDERNYFRDLARVALAAAGNSQGQAAQPEQQPVVDDLAALVRQLVHSLAKTKPDSPLVERALDYLRRKGLQGSPLRADAAPVPAAAPEPLQGWKLVPVEPTGVMKDAGAFSGLPVGAASAWVAANVYRAMLAAAPTSGAA